MAEETVSNENNLAGLQAFEMPLFQAMRRLQQDAEVHAKRLARFGGLSPVQLMILQVLASEGQMTASALSRRVSLTAATLSGQLDRLEERGLLQRQRDDQDRRRQWLLLSDSGRELLEDAPALLPPEFRARFAALPQWERHALTAALLRAAELCGDME
ncbi:MarR family transcriptional regulator [Stutzerimonas frequens]|uniref:MarR family transcriptional regulator n=1 Tax=Stutzerimonas frequens TaxID=2968969 RepID=A0ABX6XQW9_9GAMM|nr:MarR family transcriptional regulator [Stutzerimonas frequens]MCQ4304313.1 MarR family transcriptional regulator [Stutzerimonas frequens]PNF49988.1 MarR family transcriptional regulator [Stutzerimonas frequens]QPT16127.1 MarR family transcriptional regulator [Stutzerimonas frequens]